MCVCVCVCVCSLIVWGRRIGLCSGASETDLSLIVPVCQSICLSVCPLAELEMGFRIEDIAKKNQLFRSYIGMGYSNCIVPSVIQQNVLENPGWCVCVQACVRVW